MNEAYVTLAGIGVQTILYLLGVYAMVIRSSENHKALGVKVKAMDDKLEKLAEVLTQQAVQNTRIDNLASHLNAVERRMEDLSKGIGWKRPREMLDGEYK